MIDRQAMLPGEEADATGGRETSDADPAVIARGQCPAVGREERRDVHPARARLDPDDPVPFVDDLHAVHVAEVDDDAAVVGAAAADAVAAGADAKRQMGVLTRELQRVDDLLRVLHAEDEARGAAAHVGALYAGVGVVARLDRDVGKRGRDVVVVDALAALRADRRALDGGSIEAARQGSFCREAEGGGDLSRKRLHLRLVVGHQDEGPDAVLDNQRQEILDPARGGAVEEALASLGEGAGDVQDAADLARISSGRRGCLVDAGVAGAEIVNGEIAAAEGDDPAVGLLAEELQHARLVGAEPDGDVVGRERAGLGATDLVVLAGEAHGLAVADIPHAANDRDRLFQRLAGIAGGAVGAAHRLDALPEGARTEPEREASVGEQVEAGGGAGEKGRRAKRQADDVRGEADTIRHAGDPGEQRPRVEVLGDVGVVLEGDDVVAKVLASPGEVDGALRIVIFRGDEGSEFERVSVVHDVLMDPFQMSRHTRLRWLTRQL